MSVEVLIVILYDWPDVKVKAVPVKIQFGQFAPMGVEREPTENGRQQEVETRQFCRPEQL